MPFPLEPLPVKAELLIGGSVGWVDITDDVRLESAASGGGIAIARGRTSEGTQTEPGELSLTIDNRSGRYSPRNPRGEWSGLFNRNTPIRIGVTLAKDAFNRSSASGWGVTDDGRLYTVVSGVNTDFQLSGTIARCLHPTINLVRGIVLDRDWEDVEQVSRFALTFVPTGASVVAGHVARRQPDGSYYWFRLEFDTLGRISVKISKQAGSTFTEIAAISSVPGFTYAANQVYYLRSSVCGQRLSLKIWPSTSVEPVGWLLSAVDADPALAGPGRAGIFTWVVGGNTNPSPEVRVDDYEVIDRRFFGEVSVWPARWDVGGFDRWTPIEASGILRRLNQGNPPIRSAVRRAHEASTGEDSGLLLYWPIEDGTAAGQAGSVVSTVPALTIQSGIEFKPVEDFVDPFDPANPTKFGTSALADLSAGGLLKTAQAVPSSVTAFTAGSWTIGIHAGGMDPANMNKDLDLLEWETPGGTYVKWRLRYLKAATRVQVLGYKADNSEWLFVEQIGVALDFGPRFVSASAFGGSITITLQDGDGALPLSFTTAGTMPGIGGNITVNRTGTTSTAPIMVGHLALWEFNTPPAELFGVTDQYGQPVYGPWASHQNETAINRMIRLCAEEKVPLDVTVLPTVGKVIRMGWQQPGAFLDLLRDCAEADGGILFEQRDGLGLVYRPRASLYNQTPLALSYSGGHISAPFKPDEDDAAIVNQLTVSRREGSSVIVSQETGPLSIVPPPGGIGTYGSSVELNLATDATLPDQGGWRLHLGTIDEARYPTITATLASSAWAANPALASRAAAVDSGDVVAVGSLPAWQPEQVKTMIQGTTEVLDAFRRDITWNATPGSAWDIAVWGATRYDTGGSESAAPFVAGTDTAMTVNTLIGPAWSTTAGPFDIDVGGVRLTVTSVSGAASPQTFTVVQTVVNGINKTIPAKTPIRVWNRGVYLL